MLSSEFVGDSGDLPWKCEVMLNSYTKRIFLFYAWTVGHGGRGRAVDEYRIQAKLRNAGNLQFGGGRTVLLGYYGARNDRVGRQLGNAAPADMEVFVAWDATYHVGVGRSSSCQVKFATLYDAYLKGAASMTRNSRVDIERVFAFRVERLKRYLILLLDGHGEMSLGQLAT
jgi:hypothetical protein